MQKFFTYLKYYSLNSYRSVENELYTVPIFIEAYAHISRKNPPLKFAICRLRYFRGKGSTW